jgi:hypothetical protein
MALKHVENIKHQHLVIQESAVMIMQQVLRPVNQGLYLASSWVVNVTYAAREQPRISIHEYLFR